MRLSRSAPRWVLLMNLSAWCPTFARVGAPGEARLAGVTGLTWGSSTGAQVPHLLTTADVGHRPKKSQALSAAGGPGNGRAFAGVEERRICCLRVLKIKPIPRRTVFQQSL